MTRLTWDDLSQRKYQSGVSNVVLYPSNGIGVSWSGVVSIDESGTDGEADPLFIDGVKYSNRVIPEEFKATLTAITFPDEWLECDGVLEVASGLYAGEQYRRTFGLCYKTKVGDAITGLSAGYKLHLVYNAVANPTDKSYKTLSSSVEPSVFAWDISASPVTIPNFRPTSHLIIDSTKSDAAILSQVEDLLYGTNSNNPGLPAIEDLVSIFVTGSPTPDFVVTDNGDGTFTITASDSALVIIDASTFQLISAGVTDNGDGTYTATST